MLKPYRDSVKNFKKYAMLLRLPVEVRFMVYRNLNPHDVRHIVEGSS